MRDDSGFTLMEILVVVVIVGLLAMLGTNVFAPAERAMEDLALAKCREYHDAVKIWRLQGPTRSFPESLEEMQVPLAEDEDVFVRIVKDPWNRAFRLEIEGRKVRVWSDGPDRQPGTDDDIAYIPPEE